MGKMKDVRISLTLSPKAAERLDIMQNSIDAPSAVDVIRTALRVFDYIVDQNIEGNEVCIRNSDGDIKELILFY